MAMNKKEQAEVEALKTALAFRFTSNVLPDLQPPTTGSELRKGWLFNVYSNQVDPACTSVISHSVGRDDQARSQGCRVLFSTKLRALRALRYAVEQECALKLRQIDVRIESEQKAENLRAGTPN